MRLLHNKVAIVTGSSRGIGAEIARTLANAGAKTIVNYVENRKAAEVDVLRSRKQGAKRSP